MTENCISSFHAKVIERGKTASAETLISLTLIQVRSVPSSSPAPPTRMPDATTSLQSAEQTRAESIE